MSKLKFLYIFPHPDDESFGPSPVMYRHLQDGHEVHLLTLTKGGASSARHGLNLSIEEYGDIRWREMQKVSEVLGLTSLTVLDLEDGGLCEMAPQEVEDIVQRYFNYLMPDIVVTYPVHGISGHPDHLVTHAAVKRVFSDMSDQDMFPSPKRLAFFTMADEGDEERAKSYLWSSPQARIDCEIELTEQEQAKFQESLDCYETYSEIINRTGVRNISKKRYYEFYQESFDTPVSNIEQELKDA